MPRVEAFPEGAFAKHLPQDVKANSDVWSAIKGDPVKMTGIPVSALNNMLQQVVDEKEEQIRQELIKLGWTPPSTGQIPIAELKVETQMISPPNPICYHVRVGGKSVALLLQGEVAQAVERFNSLLEKRRCLLVEKIPSVDIEDYYADPRN